MACNVHGTEPASSDAGPHTGPGATVALGSQAARSRRRTYAVAHCATAWRGTVVQPTAMLGCGPWHPSAATWQCCARVVLCEVPQCSIGVGTVDFDVRSVDGAQQCACARRTVCTPQHTITQSRVRTQARMHTRTHTRAHTHTHAHTHACMRPGASIGTDPKVGPSQRTTATRCRSALHTNM